MKLHLSVCSAFLVLMGWGGLFAAPPPAKPNVIVFLVDDMGWRDCGAYGSTYYETPHIDRLATRAMRFTDAYSQPLCSPTRACLLTGKAAARHGITGATGHLPPQSAGYTFLPAAAPANRALIRPDTRHELFNLRDDLGETTNLAAMLPEKVQQLDTLIDGFLNDTAALVPQPNPAYKPRAGESR